MFPPHTMLPASKFGAGQPHPRSRELKRQSPRLRDLEDVWSGELIKGEIRSPPPPPKKEDKNERGKLTRVEPDRFSPRRCLCSFPKSAPSTKTSDRLPNFSFDGFEIVSATTAIVFFNSRSPGTMFAPKSQSHCLEFRGYSGCSRDFRRSSWGSGRSIGSDPRKKRRLLHSDWTIEGPHELPIWPVHRLLRVIGDGGVSFAVLLWESSLLDFYERIRLRVSLFPCL